MEIGVDIIEINRFKVNKYWIEKILSPFEIKEFNNHSRSWTEEKKREFLAGRWACKEAIIKSMGKIIPFNLLTINILNNKLNCTYANWEFKISLSHNKLNCIAFAIGKEIIKKF